jgi:predicted ATPase
MGDTVNVAARLRAESESGEILVGADTYRLTKPIFEFDRLEPVKVKGKIEPVSAFRLADVKSKPESVRGLAGLESEMIGRESEFGILVRMTEAVKAGLGRSVLILGEPGLGKSRLITEWLSELDQDSSASKDASTVRWAIGHCLSYGHGQAYHLLLDLLRSLIDVPTTLDEREKSAILKSFTDDLLGSSSDEVYPYLSHLLSIPMDGEERKKVSSLDPSDLQALYMVSIRRLLLAIAEREPLILICEDIHWADPSSIEILLKLLPVINESRVILCFTARPEREIPGWKLVTTMREEFGAGLEEIELHSLTDDDSRQLISSLLQFEAIPGQVRSLILERAEGNPLYVEEVIRMLVDRGLLVREDGLWNARADIDSVDIPDTLHGLLLARIDRLPDDVRHTLRVASVVGRQFSVRVLEDVLLNI